MKKWMTRINYPFHDDIIIFPILLFGLLNCFRFTIWIWKISLFFYYNFIIAYYIVLMTIPESLVQNACNYQPNPNASIYKRQCPNGFRLRTWPTVLWTHRWKSRQIFLHTSSIHIWDKTMQFVFASDTVTPCRVH